MNVGVDARRGAAAKAGRAQRTSLRDGGTSSVLFLPHVRRHNLPAHASSFVGREDDIATVSEQIADNRLVNLVGPGGVGKTRLALRVAGNHVSKFVDGVWLVELTDLGAADDVAEAVAAAFPDHRAPGTPIDLGQELADHQLLLVLDNCEHVRASCAAFVSSVLQACPEVSVLATSREPLGISGEQVVRVASLGRQEPDGPVSSSPSESARLFAARAGNINPAFELTADVLPDVEELCRRLDGLPLAIELAAARTAVLSPAEILGRLTDDARVLTDRSTLGRPERHRSLTAVLNWSYGLLSDEETGLLTRLAVFPDGCDLAEAEAVCAGDGVDAPAILDLLASLVAKSLVIVESGPAATRYRVPWLVQGLTRTRLARSDAADRWAEAHARWCIVRAEEAARRQSDGRSERWLHRLDREYGGFLAALLWARDHGRVEIVLRLAAALRWFWESRGQLAEGVDWLRWALAQEPAATPDLRAPAVRALGILTWLQGGVAEASSLVDEAAGLFRAAGNETEAEACLGLGIFHLCANATHSLPALEADVAKFRASDDLRRLARSLINCGNAHFFAGHAARSTECFDECLALPRGDVDAEVVVDAEIGRGRVVTMGGELAAGERAFGAALEVAELSRDDDGRSTALAWLGEVSRIRGDLERARDLLTEAMELAARAGLPLSQAKCQQFRARVEAADGDLTTARALYVASLAPTAAASLPYHRVRCLQGLAEVARTVGDADEARRLAGEALALGDAHGDPVARASSLTTLARLAQADGDAVRALALAHEAFDLRVSAGDAIGTWDSLEALAELAAWNGRATVAARLVGSAHQARQCAGCRPPLVSDAVRLRDLPLVAEVLRRGTLATAVNAGMSLSPAEAVALARRGRATRVRPPVGWPSLTAVERRVAELAADDRTNPEIGRHLLISQRTVQAHLTHIYRKLGVANRRALLRATHERNAAAARASASGPTLTVVSRRAST